MRLLAYGTLAIPLLLFDALLLLAMPKTLTRFYSINELVPATGGAAAYLFFHAVVRKPDRLYLWGHELTHLFVAKLFLRTVHGFHITSRDGGRVVIDGTNVWIDLAPYLFPAYNLLLAIAVSIFRPAQPWGSAAYLTAASFLFSMHLFFSAEGFLQGQPDLKRSGRPFSLALVVLFLAGTIPILLAPATVGGRAGLVEVYGYWAASAAGAGRELFRTAVSIAL